MREEARTRKPLGNAAPASTRSALKAVLAANFNPQRRGFQRRQRFLDRATIPFSPRTSRQSLAIEGEFGQTKKVLWAAIGFVSLVLTAGSSPPKFIAERGGRNPDPAEWEIPQLRSRALQKTRNPLHSRNSFSRCTMKPNFGKHKEYYRRQ